MATRRANRRGVAGAPATATAASMMASPAAAAASSRADLSAAAARTPLPAVTLDELVVGGADDLASEEEQENEDLKLHARPDQHYGNDSSSSEDEDDQLDSAPNDLARGSGTVAIKPRRPVGRLPPPRPRNRGSGPRAR